MQRAKVHSSNIRSVGYDPATRKLHAIRGKHDWRYVR